MRSAFALTVTLAHGVALASGPPSTGSPASFAPIQAVGEAAGAEPLAASQPEGAILGEWLTEKRDGRVRFVRASDGTYTGVLTWSVEDKKDTKNPDPKLRDRSIVGIVLMWHLKYDDGEYVDGYCYNPQDGDTYRMKAEVLSADTMKVRGYLAIPLLGQTQQWTRFR